MTQEEHNLLVENNNLLKEIASILRNRNSPQQDVKEFVINILANMINNQN